MTTAEGVDRYGRRHGRKTDAEVLRNAAIDVLEGTWTIEDAAADVAVSFGRPLTRRDAARLREAVQREGSAANPAWESWESMVSSLG